MSTDYAVICTACKEARHLGVRFTTGWAFGHGTGDVEEQQSVGEWIMKHIERGCHLTVDYSELTPNGCRYIVGALDK